MTHGTVERYTRHCALDVYEPMYCIRENLFLVKYFECICSYMRDVFVRTIHLPYISNFKPI